MTVTIFIPWFLPAYKAGGPIQTVANLVAVPVEGLRYRVVTSNSDWDGSTLEVQTDRWIPFNRWTEVYYTSATTGKDLFNRREEVFFLNGMYSWPFVLKPLLFGRARKMILSPRGMLLPGALAQKGLKKRLYFRLWKWAGLHRRVQFHATDSAEAASIRKIFGKNVNIGVVANIPRTIPVLPVLAKKRGELVLVTIALLGPMKNILPVLKALKGVEQNITYHLWGPVIDPPYWKACERAIKALPPNIRVVYGGDLPPARLEEVLSLAHVFVMPSRSENFGHALYEALAAGRPVITSHNTPWKALQKGSAGINVDPGKEEEVANAMRFFADMEEAELKTWSAAAAALAKRSINREDLAAQYHRLFLEEEEQERGNT
ncbi:glycosyltransferase [Flavisolibacter sp. BT320]|nr:glycosyltransferase [Flavisolibacter longurius]